MKIADIINQIRGVLPKYTDYFSDILSVSSISAAGGVATITTTAPHGLTTGMNIVLSDVVTETSITAVSQDGLVFTFTTGTDHDLTYGWPDHEYINLSGFTDVLWNDDFLLVGVPNRRNFKVQSINTIPVLNGNEILNEIRIDGINGRYSIVVTGASTITISGSFDDGNYSGGTISTAQRVSGAATEQRAIEQYTEQGLSDMWLFVVPTDATTSRDRSSYSDSTSTKTTGNDMRLRLIDGFTIILIKNTTQDIGAIDAVDICRHELLLPILKSVNGIRFDTGLSYDGDFRTIITGHGFADYNRAYLIYRYEFEVAMDLTNDDTVENGDTRAYLDTDYYHLIGGEDTQPLTILPIDEDEIPL